MYKSAFTEFLKHLRLIDTLNFIGVFLKWNRNSLNSANSRNLINHWSMNSAVVVSWSLTKRWLGGRFEPFYCNDKYFCHSLNSVKTFRENSIAVYYALRLLFLWAHQLWFLTKGKRLYCDRSISTLPFFSLLSSHSFRQYNAGYSKSKWNLLANNLFDSFSKGRWSIPSMQTLWTSLPLKWK